MGRKVDFLTCIPPAHAVRRRLQDVERQLRELKVLLRTAEQIEAAQSEAGADDEESEEAPRE